MIPELLMIGFVLGIVADRVFQHYFPKRIDTDMLIKQLTEKGYTVRLLARQ